MVATCFSPFILNNLVSFNPINLKFGGIIKPFERHLPCKFGKNSSRRTWFMNLKNFPIHSYGKIAYSFLTTCTRRCLTRHWGNVVAKICSLDVFLTPRRADLHGGKLFGDRDILSILSAGRPWAYQEHQAIVPAEVGLPWEPCWPNLLRKSVMTVP